MHPNKLGLTIAAMGGAAFVLANVGSFATSVALAARLLAGLALLFTIAVIWRRSRPADRAESTGGSALLVIIAAEMGALVGGLVLLNGVLDTPGAGVAWIATVVGVHFFALAKLLETPSMNWLAAAMTACGLLGGLLVVTGAGQASVDAVAGVLTGMLLLGFPWIADRPNMVLHAA